MSPPRTRFRLGLTGLVAVCLLGLTPVRAPAETSASSFDLWLPSPPARGPAWLMTGIGRAHIESATRSGEAQKFLDQGFALLGEGWPAEADRAFERAAALDSRCAMAQVGIAMVGLGGARRDSAVARAQRLAEGASARDRLYIEAVAAAGTGGAVALPGPFAITSDDYRRALRKIVTTFPGDLTARVLLAQSLITGFDADGAPRAGTSEAIALCEGVLNKDPSNAAANHPLAHAYESSPWRARRSRSPRPHPRSRTRST